MLRNNIFYQHITFGSCCCKHSAGAALCIAGLAADGITIVDDIVYIQRGYERFEEKLRSLFSFLFFFVSASLISGIMKIDKQNFSSVYAKESANNKTCYVVIAGDRGLAGGYNANLFKCLEASAEGKDYMVLPVGKKAVEYFRQRGIEALTEQFAEAGDISVADCFEMANILCSEFRKGTFGHIELCYTVFNSMLST